MKKKLLFIVFIGTLFFAINVSSNSMPGLQLLLLNPPSSDCGAYIASGVWKEFDCYNLAAIGKTTGDDPFIPSWRLNGGYWKWGEKGPDSSQWHSTNTSNFAHGPTGSDTGGANDGGIAVWDSSYAPDDSWLDASKTANDPCPAGFRVPTKTQWEGVDDNNTQSIVGSWLSSVTNYSSARFFGDDLMLPTTGYRAINTGQLGNRGSHGNYWSSSQTSSDSAWNLYFSSLNSFMYDGTRKFAYSVRCVAE